MDLVVYPGQRRRWRSVSLQGMHAELRPALVGSIAHDVDMVEAIAGIIPTLVFYTTSSAVFTNKQEYPV